MNEYNLWEWEEFKQDGNGGVSLFYNCKYVCPFLFSKKNTSFYMGKSSKLKTSSTSSTC